MHSNSVVADLAGTVADMVERLRSLPPGPPTDLTGTDVAAECAALIELVDTAQALVLERVAVLDQRGPAACGDALTARGWLRREARCADATAARLVSLARRLHTDPERPLRSTAAALREGSLTCDQAAAVADSTAAAPAEVVADVEAALVRHGSHLGASELRRVGLSVARRLAEQAGDSIPARVAESGDRYLRLRTTVGGRVVVDGILEPDTGRLLAAVLDPLAVPTPMPAPAPDGSLVPDPRTAGQRRHDALHEALTLLAATDRLSEQGGARPTVQVLVDARDWQATTVEGDRLSESTMRQHACDAEASWVAVHRASALESVGHGAHDHDSDNGRALTALRRELDDLPPALGGQPRQVLAAGRSSRLVTAAQRRVLVARDRGCTVRGCHAPPSRCHAHHVRHWIDGGPTNLDNLTLLCPAHHRYLHEQETAQAALPHAPPRAA